MRDLLIVLSTLVILTGCGGSSGSSSNGNNAADSAEPAPQLELSFSAPPIDLPDTPAQFVADLPYGDGERNVLDIFLPDSDTPTPLVIFYHGGGYTSGDKSSVYETNAADIREFLGAGVAFATVNYHLLSLEPPLDPDGVIRPLTDGARALQFTRYYAESLNIDPAQVVTYGISAGASTSLWLATHDDLADPGSDDPVLRESSRINAIAALFTQSTVDAVRWEEVLAPVLDPLAPLLGGSTEVTTIAAALNASSFLYTIFGVSSDEEIFTEENIAYRANIDALGLMDAGDAPIYVFNSNAPFLDDLLGLLLHHTLHAIALQQRAEEVGLENVVYAIDEEFGIEDPSGEGHVSFLLRHLR